MVWRALDAARKFWQSKRREAEFARQLTCTREAEAMGDLLLDRQHINPPWECWCNPDLVLEPGHGEELPTGRELAQAIADAIAGRADD